MKFKQKGAFVSYPDYYQKIRAYVAYSGLRPERLTAIARLIPRGPCRHW